MPSRGYVRGLSRVKEVDMQPTETMTQEAIQCPCACCPQITRLVDRCSTSANRVAKWKDNYWENLDDKERKSQYSQERGDRRMETDGNQNSRSSLASHRRLVIAVGEAAGSPLRLFVLQLRHGHWSCWFPIILGMIDFPGAGYPDPACSILGRKVRHRFWRETRERGNCPSWLLIKRWRRRSEVREGRRQRRERMMKRWRWR